MDFDLSSDQRALIERAHVVCRAHCTPEQEADRDARPRFPGALHRALGESGLIAHALPKEFGGGGGSLFDVCLIAETLGRYSSAALSLFFINGVAGAVLAAAGSPQQRERFLPALARSEIKLACALTEASAGSDLGALRTSAIRDSDAWIVEGSKRFTTGALEADHILTLARTLPEGKASSATTLFLIPAGSQGLSCSVLPKIAGNAIPSCDVRFDRVRIPDELRVGPENHAWGFLAVAGAFERLVIAASSVGLADAAFEEAMAYLQKREQFGQSVSKFQAIQHQLADLATRIEAMRWITYHAAWLATRGAPCPKEISMAKVFSSEGANEVLSECIRLVGGIGYLDTVSLGRRLREGMLGVYAGGTSEVQRNTIARAMGL